MTTELFAAVAAGDRATVERLVAADPALIQARNETGVSPIVWARYTNQPEIADLLADRAPSLDLFEAAATGRADWVRELLDRQSAKPDDVSPDGFTALHLAAFFGHPAVAALLLERGAPVDCVATNDMSVVPLHSAVAGRHDAVVRLLVESGADVHARQEGGWTAIHAAAQHGDEATVDLLIAHGADPNPCTEDGATAADLAAAGGYAELAERLRTGAPE